MNQWVNDNRQIDGMQCFMDGRLLFNADVSAYSAQTIGGYLEIILIASILSFCLGLLFYKIINFSPQLSTEEIDNHNDMK